MVEGTRRKEGAADAGPGRRPAREAGGIGIGWIRNAASAAAADAGERLRDVSLEDGPSDARDEAAQADALRRAVVEVTRVLESGAARGAVERPCAALSGRSKTPPPR